jgi:hypothetical protein
MDVESWGRAGRLALGGRGGRAEYGLSKDGVVYYHYTGRRGTVHSKLAFTALSGSDSGIHSVQNLFLKTNGKKRLFLLYQPHRAMQSSS